MVGTYLIFSHGQISKKESWPPWPPGFGHLKNFGHLNFIDFITVSFQVAKVAKKMAYAREGLNAAIFESDESIHSNVKGKDFQNDGV